MKHSAVITETYTWDAEQVKTLLCAAANVPEADVDLRFHIDGRIFTGITLTRKTNVRS